MKGTGAAKGNRSKLITYNWMQQKHQHEPGHTRAHRSELVDASCQLRVRNELHEEQIPQDETTASRNGGTVCLRGLPWQRRESVVDLHQCPLRLAILRRHGWLPKQGVTISEVDCCDDTTKLDAEVADKYEVSGSTKMGAQSKGRLGPSLEASAVALRSRTRGNGSSLGHHRLCLHLLVDEQAAEASGDGISSRDRDGSIGAMRASRMKRELEGLRGIEEGHRDNGSLVKHYRMHVWSRQSSKE
jgi:hypothetical protein